MSPAIEQRAHAMLGKMTLEEKIDLIGGENDMFIRAMPDAGFPQLKMSDGPMGVRTWGPSTAYAAGIGLAAAWDPELAEKVGVSLGRDARARGVNFLLGPGVNIYRAPMNGRNFEYLGEDPYLSARNAVRYIDGVQSQGVIATVKHYAANNQEFDRHNVSSDVDERTLREIYFPAFEAAVREAHVGAVMNSYNLVNGVHATQNPFLNLQVLRKDWGFQGIVMSDWDATYDAVGAANNGLDLEMPYGKFMNRKNLLPAVHDGKVTTAAIDEKVQRIFATSLRFHFLDRPQLDLSLPLYSQEGRRVALQCAREGITLLKNEGGVLPLSADTIKTIAVLGPDAWPAVSGGGGSSEVTPFESEGIMTGLSNFGHDKVRVLYARGLPTFREILKQTKFDSGVRVEFFDNDQFTGTPRISTEQRIGPSKNAESTPRPTAIRYTASYTPAKSGNYFFLVSGSNSDTYKLTVNDKMWLEQHHREGQAPRWVEIPLQAGKPTSIRLDYIGNSAGRNLNLGIRSADEMISPESRKIAALADAAVVAVGFDTATESEGSDRTFQLPWGQDALIQAVASENKKTIVAITAGGGVDIRTWIDKVPVLLQNWYPGEEGGRAIAEILFGAHNPEGKLPATFDGSWEESPVHDSYYATTGADGIPHVKYSEGLFYGYRYYTSASRKPLFPFGFGLSYTTFSFSGLEVTPASVKAGDEVTVSFDVTNTGRREGAEVAQLYVSDPSATVKRPVMELKGFEKVRLAPGAKQRVTLKLNDRSFSYYDVASHQWKIDPGKFTILVGDSSENTPLKGDLTIGK
ncbi:MAG TPA: glycoside hydrolase family 3 C-terminal domain-containing protein [Acidisarcina sp.]|nr:glycoside hydrolase family 3 C-terminal domain-containing protein [Acidisarcina sp.]